MIPAKRKWFGREPASVEAIGALRDAAGAALPPEYLQLLAFSNGGEGPLAVQPWNFCLDSAEEAAKYRRERTFEEFFRASLCLEVTERVNCSRSICVRGSRGPSLQSIVATAIWMKV